VITAEECVLGLAFVVVKLELIRKNGRRQKIELVQYSLKIIVELVLLEIIHVIWDVFGFR
tara:strand:+ start:485 stop:664 length:180 start_codon:yes stop_codon:yes gene_type:complete